MASAAAQSCSRPGASVPTSRVSIVRTPAYTQELYDTVRRLLLDHKLNVRGKRVLLKPNLVEFDKSTCINTHPLLVHAAFEAFRSLGAGEVRIAEGPGHRRITLDLAEAAGYFDVFPNFEDVFIDLNLDDVTEVALSRPASKLESLYLPKSVISCDVLVSMPKMKTHHWVGATLSMKNLFGTVPGAVYGWPKNILHWAGIDECIADLYRTLSPQFSLVDGVEAMEGNGPIQGTPKHAGVLIGGRDAVAVDATACRVMMIDPRKIQYMKIAAAARQMDGSNVEQIGEPIASVRTRFELIHQLKFLEAG
jgi:uncharacterized protein (DUF362 family)